MKYGLYSRKIDGDITHIKTITGRRGEGRQKGKEPKEERHAYQGAKKPPAITIISCVLEHTRYCVWPIPLLY
jgi:hypothetical protein